MARPKRPMHGSGNLARPVHITLWILVGVFKPSLELICLAVLLLPFLLLLIIVNCLYAVMSDEEHEHEEGVTELFTTAKISKKGLVKLAAQDISDKGTLLLLSDSDISHLKLVVADKARLVAVIKFLREDQDPTSTGSAKPVDVNAASTSQGNSGGSVLVQPPNIPVTVEPPSANSNVISPNIPVSAQVVPPQVGQSSIQFGLADVAGFLSGRQLPPELNSALNALQIQNAPTAISSLTGPTRPDLPGLFATADNSVDVTSRYPRLLPILPTVPSIYNDVYGQQQALMPAYMPALLGTQNIPSRMNTTQTLARDPMLQSQFAGYQNSVLRDFSNINSIPRMPAGEGLLYLPVNFVSHVRGSGSRGAEDEELLKTESGAKLYFANSPKKIGPEKLTQGLFFGANARILARIIPNLTPEVAVYLDYLRQIGDLLINYTSQSVYCLDHDHRFQVIELARPWNQIDPTLCLNVLKKKDNVASNVSSGSGSSSNSKSVSNSVAKPEGKSETKTYGSLPICWQWNQAEGCKFQNCRYHHKCSVDDCGGPHPAWKHHFRSDTVAKSP
jgi:hypothetical protein